MDDLALLPCPKPCSECPDARHHWLEHVAYPGASDDGAAETEFIGLICKHCEVTASQCDSCDGPILPVVDDSGICQDCKDEAEEDSISDTADLDPAELQTGPEPEEYE